MLVIESEFASVLNVKKRDGNTLGTYMMQGWDHGNLRSLVKNSPLRATDAHVSIIGHITQEELRDLMSRTDAYNGFLNRFLWALVKRARRLPNGGGDYDSSAIDGRLRQAVAKATAIDRVRRGEDFERLWEREFDRLTESTPGIVGSILSRGEPQTARLSMLYALLDGSAVIGEAHLRAALALWDYCEQSARMIFGGEIPAVSPLAQRLLAIITATPGITRKEQHDATHRNFSAAERVAALAELRDAGLAYPRTEATGGRAKERWYPAGIDKAYRGVSTTPHERPVSQAEEGIGREERLGREPDDPKPDDPVMSPVEPKPVPEQDRADDPKPDDPVMSLGELFGELNRLGWKVDYDDEDVLRCVARDAGAKPTPTEAIERAIATHEAELRAILAPTRDERLRREFAAIDRRNDFWRG